MSHEFGFSFHMAITKASHNQMLIKIYQIVLGMIRKYQPPVYEVDVPAEIRIHHDIFEAIQDRNVDRTRKIVKEHFDYVRRVSK